jgi:hypothetical protein
VTYYTVQISKGYQKSDTRTVLKRYSAFEQLFEDLQSLGVKLPPLPTKFHLINTQYTTEQRRKELEIFINSLVYEQATRHSKYLINFLELDQFCPELIYKLPKPIVQQQFSKQFFISRFLFIEHLDLLVLSFVDKKL